MNIKRVFLASAAIAVAGIIVPTASMTVFSWLFLLPPTDIWKWTPFIPLSSFSFLWWSVLLVGNFLLALSVVFLYGLFYEKVPGSGIIKGVVMALLLYPLGILFAAFNLYELTTLDPALIAYLIGEGFIEFLLYGAIAGVIYRP